MSTITVNSPIRVLAPRGATLAGTWFAALLNWLEKDAERRALERRAAKLVNEASYARRLAQAVRGDDPRFAADLFAAADRHELKHGA